MTYPAICREAEYLIVGMGSNARKTQKSEQYWSAFRPVLVTIVN